MTCETQNRVNSIYWPGVLDQNSGKDAAQIIIESTDQSSSASGVSSSRVVHF